MIISDEEIALVLSVLKKRGAMQNSTFNSTITKELPNIKPGHFRQKVKDAKFIKSGKKHDTDTISLKGIIFIKIYRFNNFFKKYGNIIIIVLTLIIICLMLYLEKD